MRDDLIRAILDCGKGDLSMLDDSQADMFEIIDHMKFKGKELTLNGIMGEVFEEGICRLGEAVKELRADLEKEEIAGEMAEGAEERLRKLRKYNINPSDDFGYYLNCQDTYLYFNPQSDRESSYKQEKQEVYEELFEKELQELEDYTGFDIQW